MWARQLTRCEDSSACRVDFSDARVFSAWVSGNVEGSYKRAVTLAMAIGL
jgi:hypothetical protein